MCSSRHNLVAKAHPRCLSAFCVAEMKCKVWNVPSLFALREIASADFKLPLSCASSLMKLVSKKSENVIKEVIFLDGVNTWK